MKSLIIAFVMGVTGTAAYAQDGLMKQARNAGTQAGAGLIAPTATGTSLPDATPANTATMPATGGKAINTNAVVAKLAKALKLTDAQKTSVGNAVNDYLNKKAQLAPMAATDEAGYNHQGANAYTELLSKVKAAVSKGQYASFLKLKPKAGDKTNVLNAIFK